MVPASTPSKQITPAIWYRELNKGAAQNFLQIIPGPSISREPPKGIPSEFANRVPTQLAQVDFETSGYELVAMIEQATAKRLEEAAPIASSLTEIDWDSFARGDLGILCRHDGSAIRFKASIEGQKK